MVWKLKYPNHAKKYFSIGDECHFLVLQVPVLLPENECIVSMNVLLLSDFSKPAQNAHEYAIHLLENQEVNFYITHIKKDCAKQSCGGSCKIGLQQQLNQQKETLEAFSDALLHQFESLLLEGNLLENVRKIVDLYDIDMLVMGAHGKMGKFNLKLGTNTKNLAIKVKCPVLIVFEHSPQVIPSRINFPVDYTDKLQHKCIIKFKSLPAWEHLLVNVMELVNNNTFQHQAEAKQIVIHSFEGVATSYQQEPFLDVVQSFKEVDLLLLAARNIGVCDQVFSYIEANYKDFQSASPILVLHA